MSLKRLWSKQVEKEFVKNINDTYTLNLAISVLEDREGFMEEIERLEKGLDELEELCKTKYYGKNTTDIDSIAIAGNLYVYMYKKIKELKGVDKE